MTYAVANPPKLVASGPGGGPQIWVYQDGDAHGDVDATDYFSNGEALGMRVDDVVIVVTNATGATIHSVTAISAAGAASINAGIFS